MSGLMDGKVTVIATGIILVQHDDSIKYFFMISLGLYTDIINLTYNCNSGI